jgi:hypothetical protein
MRVVIVIIAVLLLLLALWDVFETIVLPRRVTRNVRFARIFYLSTCRPWRAVGRLTSRGFRSARLWQEA